MTTLWAVVRELLFIAYMIAWIVAIVRLIPDKPRRGYLWNKNIKPEERNE